MWVHPFINKPLGLTPKVRILTKKRKDRFWELLLLRRNNDDTNLPAHGKRSIMANNLDSPF
ncbi:MAG: hypothetical protein COB78_03320 [Hyphomicrobiales bacterium]|nr:MAG: hypothetical protein COB78_03320 [Hyphomicrobiales bacterium]